MATSRELAPLHPSTLTLLTAIIGVAAKDERLDSLIEWYEDFNTARQILDKALQRANTGRWDSVTELMESLRGEANARREAQV